MLGLSTFMVVGLVIQDAAERATQDQFLKEYPRASATMESRLSVVKGIAQLSNPKENSAQSKRISVSFSFNQSLRKFEFVTDPPKEIKSEKLRHVYCLARSNYFHLLGVGDSPYRIDRVGSGLMEEAIFKMVFGKYLEAPFMVGGSRLSDLMKSGDFRLKTAKDIEAGDRRLVEIEFFIAPAGVEPSFFRVRLDPLRDWSIHSSMFRPGDVEPSETYELDYTSEFPGGQIFPKKIHWKSFDGREQICEFEQVAFTPVGEDEFRLEHYGLKDVMQYAPRESSRYYGWLIGSGIVVMLFVGSIALRKLADRRR